MKTSTTYGAIRWRRGRDYLKPQDRPKPGDRLYLDYRTDGRRIREPFGKLQYNSVDEIKTIERDARIALNERERAKFAGSLKSAVYPTYRQMALFWWEKKMEKTPWIQNDYNAKSGEWYKLQQGVEHFKETPITRSQLKAFRVSLRQRTGRNGKRWSAAYVNRIVAMVGQVYHWCISQEVFDYKSATEKERKRYGDIGRCVELDNPTHGLPVLTEEPAEAIIPTQEQFAEFLAALAPEYRNMAIIGVHTGLRRRNVVNMLKEHVDQVGGKLWVPDHKGSGSLRVALHPEALAVLRDVILGDQSGSPYVFHRSNGEPYRSFRGAWRKACSAAGIDGFQFRHLRNTYASWRVEEGVEIGLIQRSLGHTTSAMTSKHYNKAQNATEIILRTQRAINAG